MKATKKLLALVLAMCMLIGMPLSINVGAADTEEKPLHVESVYFGERGTADQDYLFIQFSEPVERTASTTMLITVHVYDLSGARMHRLQNKDTTDAALPANSDENGLYKVHMMPAWNLNSNVPNWLDTYYFNQRANGRQLICHITDDGAANKKNDGWIQSFKGKTSGTYLENPNKDYTLGDSGTEALAIDITDNYTVSLQSVARNNLTDFTLTFSEEVTLANNGGLFGLCVVQDGAMVSSKNLTVGSWRSNINGTTSTPNKTWQLGFHHSNYNMNLNTTIASFVASEYTDELRDAGAQVCFYIKDNNDNTKNGLIDSVTSSDGLKQLKINSDISSTGKRETYFYPVNVEDLFFTPTAYVATKDRIFVEVNGQYGSAWTGNTYLSAFDTNGTLLKEQKLELVSNYKKGTGENAPTINVALWFGQNSTVNYDTFVADVEKLGVEYDIKLIVKDTSTANNALGNGVVDTLIQYDSVAAKTKATLLADDAYSTDTYDAGVIPFGEIATVKSVDVNENSGQVIISFSHDIDMDKLMAAVAEKENGKAFFLGVSAVGVNNLVGYDSSKDKIVAGGWCDQTGIFNLKPYGESKNAVVGQLDMADYNVMMKNFEDLKDTTKYPNTDDLELAIRFRIEMTTGYTANTGNFPLYYTIDPMEDGVKSPYITDAAYRLWTDVNIIEAEDNKVLIGGELKDISVINTMTSGEVILMADAEVDSLTVNAGVTLDLNGKTVTVSENGTFAAFGTVKDSADGVALIKVNKDNVTLIPTNNTQTALYDGTGYRIYNYSVKSLPHRSNGTDAATYGVHVDFTNHAAYSALAEQGSNSGLQFFMNVDTANGVINNGAGLDLRFHLQADETGTDWIQEYGEACVNKLANNGNVQYIVFTLKITGLDQLPEGDSLVVKAGVCSGVQGTEATNWTTLQ